MKHSTKKLALVVSLVILLLVLTVPVASASGGHHYTVRYGDTLFKVGRMYGVNPYYIAEVNHLPNPNCIYAGQVLYIPAYDGYYDGGCSYGCSQPVYDGGYQHGAKHHVVARGETLTSIAYYYGVSPWALASANQLYDPNRIYVGQVLYIPWESGYANYY